MEEERRRATNVIRSARAERGRGKPSVAHASPSALPVRFVLKSLCVCTLVYILIYL
jgi:hypothetical protein